MNRMIINNIYYERVQLFIEGTFSEQPEKNVKFYLRNLTETLKFEAHQVILDGAHFKLRFNVAILDDGNYLTPDQYLIVAKKGREEYIATVNPELTSPTVEEEQLEMEFDTQTAEQNFYLKRYKKTYKRGGSAKNYYYEITPEISSEINEFVLKVVFKKPAAQLSGIRKKIKEIKKKFRAISFSLRKTMFQSIFYLSQYSARFNGKKVLFTSDSRSEMSGNFKFIYDKMIEIGLDKKYNILTSFKPHISSRRSLKDKFTFPFKLGRADYIFVDDFHPLIYTVKFHDKQELIQVWHACGAFKTVGYSRAGKKGGPFFDSLVHRNYTKATVSSETDIPFYAEAFGIKETNILPTGVPRTDIFFDEQYKTRIINHMNRELPIIQGKKVVLFAPTFRGAGANSAHYPFFKINIQALAEYCYNNNAVVLFKMHPFVKNKFVIPNQYKDIFQDVANYREVNDILFITDILITDYSSLIYEYSIMEKSMLFYAFDLEDYISTRDFYEPYESFVPGKIVKTFDQLIDALNHNDFEQHKVKPFLDKHFKYQDGRSSERIVKEVFTIK